MAFESLSEKLQLTIKRLKGQTRVSEKDVKEFMREIRIALLEADVNYKVVKDFSQMYPKKQSVRKFCRVSHPDSKLLK